MTTNRRLWLKQTSLAIAGLSVASKGFALDKTFSPTAGSKIILSSNENPYGPSPMARKAMMDAVASSNRYPWETTGKLMDKIANKYGLANENVLMGAGSSEILGLTTEYAALQKGNIVTANPTFQIWIKSAEKLGLQIIRIQLTADKKHDLPAMMNAINAETRMVYVCNPNNPTATICNAAALKNFVEEATKKTLVLLDEAYIEFCDEPSLASMVKENKNLVIAKTFSKIYGMAGARIGYALAHKETIEKLEGLQPWANAGASAVSLAGAMASLDDMEFVNKTKSLNAAAKDFTKAELEKLHIKVLPSYSNFMYFSLKDYNKDYSKLLEAANIVGGGIREEEGKWGRITIGTMEEMKQYIKALQ
jgi:histidinol-phosphate aminotransferase